MKRNIGFLVLAVCLGIIVSCTKENITEKSDETKTQLTLKFDHVVGDDELHLNTKYINPVSGENFEIYMYQYIISNIRLKTTDGKEVILPQEESYFFVSESSEESRTVSLDNIPFGEYSGITFTIGVDSSRSAKGLTDVPANLMKGVNQGMYWTWNTGYIFFMMEGTSPLLEHSPEGNDFMFHIGGYDSNSINNIKTIALQFDPIEVAEKKSPEVVIKMDVLKVFNGENIIRFTENQIVMFDPLSKKIADNYTEAFSVASVRDL